MIQEPNRKQLTLTRVFDAPREAVWDMFTKAENFFKWYGLTGSTVTDMQMDVRVGGSWSGLMHIPGYPDISWRGDYKEVERPEKLVFDLLNPENHDDQKVETITVILKNKDGASSSKTSEGQSETEMFFNQSGNLPESEYQNSLRDGWTHFFNKLEDHLKDIRKTNRGGRYSRRKS